MKCIKFNTKRMYGALGQRIAATVLEVEGAEYVAFEDIDRHISGGFKRTEFDVGTPLAPEEVMQTYDHGDRWWVEMHDLTRAMGYEKYWVIQKSLRDTAETLS